MGSAVAKGEQKRPPRPRIKTPPDLRRLSQLNGDITTRASPSEVDISQMDTGQPALEFLDVSLIQTDSDAKRVVDNAWHLIENQVIEFSKNPKQFTVYNDRVVRVFVSSTFVDSHSERNVLVKEVFPDLRDWCAERGLSLIEVDLRWGVPAETPASRTIEICMQNLDECHAETCGQPFFISLIADRYGWIPKEDDLNEGLISDYHWVPNVSITHMEIMHGAYRCKNRNAAFFFRNSASLDNVPEPIRKDFQEHTALPQLQLQELKKRLKSRFNGQCYDYSVHFDGYDESSGRKLVKLRGYQDFTDHVTSFLKKRITDVFSLKNDANKNPTLNESTLAIKQAQYVREAVSSFVGRSEELKTCMTFLTEKEPPCERLPCKVKDEDKEVHLFGKLTWDEKNSVPFMYLSGEQGSGKSCMLAKLVEECQRTMPDHEIFYHFFFDLDGESCNDETLLKRLIHFAKVNDFDWNEEDRSKLIDIWKEKALPNISRASKTKMIIILDGLDKMRWYESPQHLCWLPRCFPANVRCVVSSGTQHIPTTCRIIEDGPYQLNVKPLGKDGQRTYVDVYLARFGKKLDDKQMKNLLSDGRQFDWLFLACEEIRVFGDFRTVSQKILSLPGNIVELSWYIVQRLINEDVNSDKTGQTGNVEKLLKFLACERNGFDESYLPTLLGSTGNPEEINQQNNDQQRLPVPFTVWHSVKIRLKPFLRFANGKINFKLNAIGDAVRKNFLSDSQAAKSVFSDLANFYATNCASDRYLYSQRYPVCLLQSNQIEKAVNFLFKDNYKMIIPHYVKQELFKVIKCKRLVTTTPNDNKNVAYVCTFCRNLSQAKNCLICSLPGSQDGRLCSQHNNPYSITCVLCDKFVASNLLQQMASKVQLCSSCCFGFAPCCKLLNNSTAVEPFSFDLP